MLFNKVQELLPFIKNLVKCCVESPIPLEKPTLDINNMDAIEYEQVSEILGYIENYIAYAHVFLKNFEVKHEDKKREITPMNLKDLEIRDVVADHDFDDSRAPLTINEFQQRSLSILKESKIN